MDHRPAAARPDLCVILEAHPEIIARRLVERGAHNRFQLAPGSSHAEAHFYRQATERPIQAGFDDLVAGGLEVGGSGHYATATDPRLRLATAFTELAHAI